MHDAEHEENEDSAADDFEAYMDRKYNYLTTTAKTSTTKVTHFNYQTRYNLGEDEENDDDVIEIEPSSFTSKIAQKSNENRNLYKDREEEEEEEECDEFDELKKFEKLEKYVEEHPSFMSSTSFVDNLFTANKMAPNQNNEFQVKNLMNSMFPSLQNNSKHVDYDHDYENTERQKISGEPSNDSRRSYKKINFETKNTQNESSSSHNNPPISRMSSSSSSLNQNQNVLLKEKLKQLEIEIEKFQEKNLEINKLKEKLEGEIESNETIGKILKQKENEFNKTKTMHEEEVRKFKMEKRVFEQYEKTIRDNPTRKERDEIENLRKQVNIAPIHLIKVVVN
jgi:hypothetical protein